jgi:hypothetical protein
MPGDALIEGPRWRAEQARLLAQLKAAHGVVERRTQPEIHAQISALAAAAEKLAASHAEIEPELFFVAGYLRRMLK